MSAVASEYFEAIKQRYVSAAPPSTESWLFDEGLQSDGLLELERLGFIERMLGVAKGFGWRLTNKGLAEVHA